MVVCKNKRFHRHAGAELSYKIPLGETDAVSPPPAISAPFLVRCPDCGVEYSYQPEDVRRVELEVLDAFTPHPLFRDSEDPASV